jgi:hypothetical protein
MVVHIPGGEQVLKSKTGNEKLRLLLQAMNESCSAGSLGNLQ